MEGIASNAALLFPPYFDKHAHGAFCVCGNNTSPRSALRVDTDSDLSFSVQHSLDSGMRRQFSSQQLNLFTSLAGNSDDLTWGKGYRSRT